MVKTMTVRCAGNKEFATVGYFKKVQLKLLVSAAKLAGWTLNETAELSCLSNTEKVFIRTIW